MEHLRITVEGKVYEVVVEKLDGAQPAAAPVVRAAAPAVAVAKAPASAPPPAAGSGDAPSPLAGIVQAINAEVGTTVSEGDLVLTLEAMKMYTPINAPKSGTINSMLVKVGDAVEEGQILYTIG
jgi:biotin carboxyl carrier protein